MAGHTTFQGAKKLISLFRLKHTIKILHTFNKILFGVYVVHKNQRVRNLSRSLAHDIKHFYILKLKKKKIIWHWVLPHACLRLVTWWLQLGNPTQRALENKKPSMLVFSTFKDNIKQTRHTKKLYQTISLGGGGTKNKT